MSAGELSFWQDVYSREFLGAERQDYRHARLEAAVITWSGRSLKDDADPPSPLDLMPFRVKPDEPVEPDVADQVHHTMAALSGLQARAGRA